MKLLSSSLIFSIILTITSCESPTDLHQLRKTPIPCYEMPDLVYQAFDKAFKRKTKGMVESTWEDEIINLDKQVEIINLSVNGKSGVRPGIRKYKINGKLFSLSWNGNRENPPFIYYKGILYYRLSMNVLREEEIKVCECESIDLRDDLNINIPKENRHIEKQSLKSRTVVRDSIIINIQKEINVLKNNSRLIINDSLFSIQITQLDSIISINPRQNNALEIISDLYIYCNRPLKALKYLEQLESSNPMNGKLNFKIAKTKEKLDSIYSAIDICSSYQSASILGYKVDQIILDSCLVIRKRHEEKMREKYNY